MKIEGKLHKLGKFWAVEIPLLLIHTQGRSQKEALEMAKDAIETVVEKVGFKAQAELADGTRLIIGASDEQSLFATILKQQRGAKKLTIRQVASRLGSRSPTA